MNRRRAFLLAGALALSGIPAARAQDNGEATLRPLIAGELSRVVKPLGRVVVMDSLQLGDTPQFDALLKSFPANFHEPYFASYLSEDFPQMFALAGLKLVSAEPIFLSKMFVFEKA